MRNLLLILCWLVAFDASAEQKWLGQEGFLKAGAVATYTANAVDSDGTNDHLRVEASPTGLADAKTGTVSVWFKPITDAAAARFIATWSDGTSVRWSLAWLAADTMRLHAFNSGATLIFSWTSSTTWAAGSGWHHFYATWDLANSGLRSVYMDGASEAGTYSTYTNDTIDYLPATTPRYTVAADQANTAGNKPIACLAEFWWDDTYLDGATNITDFRNSGTGKPVSLGSDGSTPSGSQPVFYLKTASPDWETNSGSGGNFTETGAFAACSDSPSD